MNKGKNGKGGGEKAHIGLLLCQYINFVVVVVVLKGQESG